MRLPSPVLLVALCLLALGARGAPANPAFDPKAVENGRSAFKSSCGFCHGNDAAGNRAPDLIRSAILNHDVNGNLLRPVIHNGRPDKGMPAFANLSGDQVSNMIAFLHSQADAALHSANVPGDYPLAKLLTGNAAQGRAYFEGAGGCSACHSVTGDLAGVASKYSPVDLQQHLVYPGGRARRTAVVVTPDGKTWKGVLRHADEFNIAITTAEGDYYSWPRAKVQVTIADPLQAHRDLTQKYTDANIHDLFAYLETLKTPAR